MFHIHHISPRQCVDCTGATTFDCLSCSNGWYNSTTTHECVRPERCPNSTYANLNTRLCEDCVPDCLTCYHPGDRCSICMSNKTLNGFFCEAECDQEEYIKYPTAGATIGLTCEPCRAACAQSPGTYQAVSCTSAHNRVCSTCSTCGAGQYIAANCTSLSDTDCRNFSVCNLTSTYQSAPGTPFKDTNCTRLTDPCDLSRFYEIVPTATTDRQCIRLTTCAVTQYENKTKTATTDRQCGNCKVCASNEQVVSACSETNNTVCAVKDLCASSPCLNNGTCTNLNGFDFSCNCSVGFGKTCSTCTASQDK